MSDNPERFNALIQAGKPRSEGGPIVKRRSVSADAYRVPSPGNSARQNAVESIDSTRLSDAKRREMISALDRAASSSSKGESGRRHDRFEYHERDIRVTILHTMGGETHLLVHGRNLSAGGMSFLHGGFLHAGTTCRVLLKTKKGIDKLMLARVAGCRHISKNIHEIGVQFYEKIDVSDFCSSGAKIISSMSISVQVPELAGISVCFNDDKAERALLSGWLSATGLSVVEASSTGAMLDRIKRMPVILVVADAKSADVSVTEMVEAVRAAPFTKPLILIPDEEGGAVECDGELRRPLEMSAFMKLLITICRPERILDHEPIYSSLGADPNAEGLLLSYCEQVQALVAQIEGAIAGDNYSAAQHACQSIRSTAVGYGFPALGDAASQALVALDVSKSAKAVRRHLTMLTSLCRRIKPGLPRVVSSEAAPEKS